MFLDIFLGSTDSSEYFWFFVSKFFFFPLRLSLCVKEAIKVPSRQPRLFLNSRLIQNSFSECVLQCILEHISGHSVNDWIQVVSKTFISDAPNPVQSSVLYNTKKERWSWKLCPPFFSLAFPTLPFLLGRTFCSLDRTTCVPTSTSTATPQITPSPPCTRPTWTRWPTTRIWILDTIRELSSQLGGRSIVFESAYVQQALCSPSRSSLMTSRRWTESFCNICVNIVYIVYYWIILILILLNIIV